ncbi:MAG: hypothetical protein ACKOYM_00800 [Actinomycetes bacterium]
MRPPRCIVCGKTLSDIDPEERSGRAEAFDTVTFADYVPLPIGMVGHPQGLEWLCAEHLDAGRARAHLPSRDAVREIRAELGLDSSDT